MVQSTNITNDQKQASSIVSQQDFKEMIDIEFLSSNDYYNSLQDIYSKISLVNRNYGICKLIYYDKKFVLNNNRGGKRDLTVIRHLIDDTLYVSSSSLATFLGILPHHLSEYTVNLSSHSISIGTALKYLIPFTMLSEILDTIVTTWENIENIDMSRVSIIRSGILYDNVMSYNKNSLELKLKQDLVKIYDYLGLPTKYVIRHDLNILINDKMYSKYLHRNSLNFINRMEYDIKSMKDTISSFAHIQNLITNVANFNTPVVTTHDHYQ